MTVRGAILQIFVTLTLLPALSAQKPPRARAGAGEMKIQQNAQQRPVARPGQRALERLSRMTPEERERALSQLPPARRQKIEQSLREMQNVPPAQQNRIRTRLELLNSLPPQRQNQVRRSLRQFLNMPDERKAVLNREMRRMAPLSDEARQERIDSEEFRNLYTDGELQMMRNLMEIQPQW